MAKYIQFETEQKALDFQQQVADVINNGDPYAVALFDENENLKYAIKLINARKSIIVDIIGQEAWDDAPPFVEGGPFNRVESKDQQKTNK